MYAERFAMIGALVQHQNQNLLRLQQAIKKSFEILSTRSVNLLGQKRYAAKPSLNPRRANARMRRAVLYQRSRVTAKLTLNSDRYR